MTSTVQIALVEAVGQSADGQGSPAVGDLLAPAQELVVDTGTGAAVSTVVATKAVLAGRLAAGKAFWRVIVDGDVSIYQRRGAAVGAASATTGLRVTPGSPEYYAVKAEDEQMSIVGVS